MEEPRPKAQAWPHAEVAFAQGDEGREQHHGVGAEVVRLHLEVVQEFMEELAHRETKTASEVCGEDNVFAGLRRQQQLIGGHAKDRLRRHLASALEAEYIVSVTSEPSHPQQAEAMS